LINHANPALELSFMNKLILFDIDGTLVDTGRAGARSLDIIFREYFSIENAFANINMAGKTDTQIIKEGLIEHNLPLDNRIINELIELYLQTLSREINNNRRRVMPGVVEILELLDNHNGFFSLGLLTGNMERGARIKLGAFHLNKYFPFGAFGSDDEDRNKLLPHALKRFQEIYKKKVDFRDCLIVGDTPRDVRCAKPYGAFCIAVATGPYSTADLHQAGADSVMDDLSDINEFIRSVKEILKI
jgi:phosphoglycolate phosphatase-like HAD superfamily hydrolase